ncbi:MAG: 50S ribosomal protein L4, partial [Candidatus Moranbacteria bacterium CG_4_9_14_3_um_filter_40_7]
MAKIKVYNSKGESSEEMELSDAIFSLPGNDELLQQVSVALLSNRRQILAHTKTRAERAGSGIKPWKQKGTGRARVGSVRSPLWKKGGVIFGPTKDRNFRKKINQKTKSHALALALSGKLFEKEITVIESFKIAEKKTRKMAEVLKNLKLKGSSLLVFSGKEKDQRRFSQNLAEVKNALASQLNVLNVLNNKNIIFSRESVKELEERFK